MPPWLTTKETLLQPPDDGGDEDDDDFDDDEDVDSYDEDYDTLANNKRDPIRPVDDNADFDDKPRTTEN